MDQQKKQLVAIILMMVKDVYEKTTHLENLFDSSNIHIFSRKFDPFLSLLRTLGLPQEKNAYFFQLMKVYVEEEMTLDEILLEIEEQVKAVESAS